MRHFLIKILSLAFVCSSLSCLHSTSAERASSVQNGGAVAQKAAAPAPVVPTETYEVVNSWPHDPQAFTQGLEYQDGALYESTGQYGESSLRKVELETGKVRKKVEVSRDFFAEGMTIFGGKIFQLTWKAQKGFIYDQKSFRARGEFGYTGEGWGLTHDEHALILSDGTNEIRFLDPKSFKVLRTIKVLDAGAPLNELNELEYIKGEIYANIWHSERIVRIDPATGKIVGWIDLKGLRPPQDAGDDDNVLNGIAYDAARDRLLVTGKRWSKIFEIRLKKQI
jgi:glutamine cyclotransferase